MKCFSSEIYHNFQTARKQKTLPAAAGFRTRDLRVTRLTLLSILMAYFFKNRIVLTTITLLYSTRPIPHFSSTELELNTI